jgi:hypothetical protein
LTLVTAFFLATFGLLANGNAGDGDVGGFQGGPERFHTQPVHRLAVEGVPSAGTDPGWVPDEDAIRASRPYSEKFMTFLELAPNGNQARLRAVMG